MWDDVVRCGAVHNASVTATEAKAAAAASSMRKVYVCMCECGALNTNKIGDT